MNISQKYKNQISEAYKGGLRAWFGKGSVGSSSGGGWDRYNSSGKKVGKCGDAPKGSSYSACLGKKYVARLRAKGGKKAISNWVKRKKKAQNVSGRGKKGTGGKGKSPIRVSYKECLNEIFVIKNANSLKNDLKDFLKNEFQKGNIIPTHVGISTSEFDPTDWIEEISNQIVNKFIEYFETIRGQTERDLYSSSIVKND